MDDDEWGGDKGDDLKEFKNNMACKEFNRAHRCGCHGEEGLTGSQAGRRVDFTTFGLGRK